MKKLNQYIYNKAKNTVWNGLKPFHTTNRKGFTLVELIIVITILAILATIAFTSFQGFTRDARDANRTATLTSISKGLDLFFVKAGNYPETESGTTILANTTPIGYQGYIGDNISRMINMNTTPLDPLDSEKYIYSTNADKSKYQLMAFNEGVSSLAFTYASTDYSKRFPKTIGSNLEVILNSDNSPITGTGIDVSTGTINYNVVFSNTETKTLSGNSLFSSIYNRRDDLLNNKTLASLDSSLVGYWPLDEIIMSGTTQTVKDYSFNNNSGLLQTGTTSSPVYSIVNGIKGNALQIDNTVSQIVGSIILPNYLTTIPIVNGGNLTISVTHKTITKIPHPVITDNGLLVSPGFRYGNLGVSVDENSYLQTWLLPSSSFASAYTVTGSTINSSDWHTTTITYDGQSIKTYNDGTFTSTSLFPSTRIFAGNLLLCRGMFKKLDGSNSINKGCGNAIFDEARVYNRALSDTEVLNLYNATR